MRFEWFAIIVVLLDIIAKLVLGSMDLAAVYPLGSGGLALEVLGNPNEPFKHFLSTRFNTSEWLLPGGLLVLFWLLFQKGRGFLSTSFLTSLGVMLAVGGIITRLVDLLVYSTVVPMFSLHVGVNIVFSLNIGDIAVTIGLVLLLVDLAQRLMTPHSSLIPLKSGELEAIDFAELPRGIDNVHVDVHFSPTFTRVTRQVIGSLVSRYLRQGFGGEKKDKVRHQDFFLLQKAYVDMVQAVTIKAKDGDLAHLDLFYIGLMKMLRKEIQERITAEVQQFTDSTERKAVGDRAKWLLSNRNIIFNKVGKAMYSMLYKIETDNINKLRKSLFGEPKHPLVEAFQAPLAFAGSPLDDDVLIQHYLLMGHMSTDPHSFGRIDRILEEVFAQTLKSISKSTDEIAADESEKADTEGDEELDLGVLDQQEEEQRSQNKEDKEGRRHELKEMIGGNEYQRIFDNPSVLMDSRNLDPLLNTSWSRHQMQLAWDAREWGRYLRFRRQYRFQRYQLALLRNALENTRLLPTIIAAYETANLLNEFGSEAPPQLIHKLVDQKGVLKGGGHRIDNVYKSTPSLPPKDEVIAASKRVNALMKSGMDEQIIRFVFDFAAYRRDLRLNVLIQQAANQVAVRHDENDLRTSRSNRLLFDFIAASETDNSTRIVKSHAIIKADLRGSTQITEELTRRKLNPATHFSRNFFNPINEVIETFGAEKVFIEGDAIILILNEREGGSHTDSLIISRACGLATGMLRVMDHQNRQLAAHGLPQLELGIGVAYQDAPANYLFDGDHRITISPAINRADRLSACAWMLRKWFKGKASQRTHVAVYEPSDSVRKQMGEKAQKDMVYNLNGILLEPSAFEKLKTELKLKQQDHDIEEFWDSTLYTSRYPDVKGRFHPLIVRESAVREYDTSYEYLETPKVEGRKFYEVVYDRKILEQLRSMVTNKTSTATKS